jgi:hypothetical protein
VPKTMPAPPPAPAGRDELRAGSIERDAVSA